MVRQKTKLFIFLNNSDTETLVNNSSIYDNCDLPLVDADISINNFCTADVKHTIKLWKDRYKSLNMNIVKFQYLVYIFGKNTYLFILIKI